MILNGECGAFNPLLLQCLTDIQTDLKEELQGHQTELRMRSKQEYKKPE